jgi:hypothetical protein
VRFGFVADPSKQFSDEKVNGIRISDASALLERNAQVNTAIEEMRSEDEPLAWHIFVSRRPY